MHIQPINNQWPWIAILAFLHMFVSSTGEDFLLSSVFCSCKGTLEPFGQFSRKLVWKLCHWRTFQNSTLFLETSNNSFLDVQTYEKGTTNEIFIFRRGNVIADGQTERRWCAIFQWRLAWSTDIWQHLK